MYYNLLYVQLCVMLHTQESRMSDQLISSHTKVISFSFHLEEEKRKMWTTSQIHTQSMMG